MKNSRIILFDGVCNLCNTMVQFVIRHDPAAKFTFASLQSEEAQHLLQPFSPTGDQVKSIILLDGGKMYDQSTAALKIARNLQGPVKFLYGFIIVPAFIRDAVYKLIARNRYRWFGKRDECLLPDENLKDRFIS